MLLLPLTLSWAPSTRHHGRNQPGIILTLCCDASSARNGSSPSMALLRRRDSKAGELRPSPLAPRCYHGWVSDAVGKDLGAHGRYRVLLKLQETESFVWGSELG